MLVLVGCNNESGRRPIVFVPVPGSAAYPSAAAPDSLEWACAKDPAILPAFFNESHLPFEQGLVQQRNGMSCHIFYEPTIPGFHASPDSDAATGIRLNLDSLAFHAGREEWIGDVLDVAKTVLGNLGKPVEATLGITPLADSAFAQQALKLNFPNSPHTMHFRHIPAGDTAPWAQDFFKSGQVGKERKTLIPFQAFEGSAELGVQLKPMLDSLAAQDFARSNLSWEGGDIQLTRHPHDPSKVLLFYGTSAKPYWGEALSHEEFAYILRVEFGASEAVYMGDLTPHVDYMLSFIQQTAVLSEPVCNNSEISRAALELLVRNLEEPTPPELVKLREAIDQPAVLAAAYQARSTWKRKVNAAARQPILDYVAANCPANPAACIAPDRLPGLLTSHRGLLQNWVYQGGIGRTQSRLTERMLDIMEGQLTPCAAMHAKFADKAVQLTRLGFRVIRTPWIPPGPTAAKSWAGISYANAALIQNTLFVPRFGLGPIEKQWFAELMRRVPEPVRVIPVPARLLMLENGGVHCTIAFDRVAN